MADQNIVLIVAGAAVVLLLVGVLAWVAMRRKGRQHIVDRHGSQFDRAVEQYGSASKAQKELEQRERMFEKANIRDLSPADRERYSNLWRTVQARFVDSPGSAVAEADTLVGEIMRVRGYPAADLEQRLADVAVGHPTLVEAYREACDIALRSRTGAADTEDLRRAMVHYRSLFEDLLGAPERELVGSR